MALKLRKSCEIGCDLSSVIATHELDSRPYHAADESGESKTFVRLTQELARSPNDFFQKLVEAALKYSNADSTGISLLDDNQARFVWPAVAGPLKCYLGSGTPSDFGPCGVVLECNAAVLFQHPERHFLYLSPIDPPLREVLLIPFHKDDKAVGTIWAVIHKESKKFTAEDRRVLQNLSEFAASAYHVLSRAGAIVPLLEKIKYDPDTVRPS